MQGSCHCLFVHHLDPKNIIQSNKGQRLPNCDIIWDHIEVFQYNCTFSIGFPSQTRYISRLKFTTTEPSAMLCLVSAEKVLPPNQKEGVQKSIKRSYLQWLTSWWFQPIQKIFVNMGFFPPKIGMNITNHLSCHHPDYHIGESHL